MIEKVIKKTVFVFLIFCYIFSFSGISAQNIDRMYREADQHYSQKEYNRALAVWMDILAVDIDNERAQRGIESIFEIKQRKALTLETARLEYRMALLKLGDDKTKEKGIDYGNSALRNFVSAYRLDPRDPVMQDMMNDMRILEKEVRSAEAQVKVAHEMRQKARDLKEKARAEMDADPPRYDVALGYWQQVLQIFPLDTEALEGARESELAHENFVRYQNIRRFIERGDRAFEEEDFRQARTEYSQALSLDPGNRDARKKIARAEEKVAEAAGLEQRRQQAENYYQSALMNISEHRYDLARDDLENSLTLVSGYRDSEQRLGQLETLKARYLEKKEQERLEEINRFFQRGILYLNEGNYTDAISSFNRTIELDPGNDLAERYLSQARQAQAVVEEEVVDRDSQYYDIVQALIASGKQLYENGNYAESRKRWERILNLFPQNRIATEYILRCDLNLDPQRFEALASGMVDDGRKHIKDGEYERAYRMFALIKSVRPEYPEIDQLMAMSRKEGKREKTSPARVDRAELDRRYRQGQVYFQRGDRANIERSVVEFRFVVDNDPGHTQSVIALNRAQAQLRGAARRSAVFETPQMRLTPEQEALVRRHYFQGISYYSNNDYNRAIAEWRKVLAIDPAHAQARSNIERSLALIGR